MMESNTPEMKPTGDRETILTQYAEGATKLENTLRGLSESDLDLAPEKGGWSIREIVHHTADGDDIWKFCIKMALGNEESEFHLEWYWALPQTDWAASWVYTQRPVSTSIELLKVSRTHILELLARRPDGWERSVKLSKRDGDIIRISVGFILEMQATHVFHHIDRILAIRKEHGV